MVKYLVKKGVGIHVLNKWVVGLTALNGHLEIVKYLVEKKVDITENVTILLNGLPGVVFLEVI